MTINEYIKASDNNLIKGIKWLGNRQSLKFKILEFLKVLCTSIFLLHSINILLFIFIKLTHIKNLLKFQI